MALPTVGEFCCCINLITGGKILGWLGVIQGVLYILAGFQLPQYFLGAIICLVVSGCWLYGIEKTRPSYMLLDVVVTAIGLVILYIADVFVLFAIVLALSSGKPIDTKEVPLPGIVIILIIANLIATYFAIVTYSVYKAVKELSEARLPTVYQAAPQGVTQGAKYPTLN
ncbi:uncharacterized protein LOC129566887 [Sitodiplosis mosellana]|uniref:uncharacterized protein LOC129566887 n=1 Tax=Sitodiplosis mosellana TaxID=263140 RepID=UPI002443B4DC|nr:uncharacterized protein LOC129566887 [Sitodiplosis mosellana]XP_055299233.1 uncharacterized protein LOC129566887 [Sitodiplosis mosellana]